MPVNCDDFLNLVTKALDTASSEIEYRNIISMAYYSSYHRLRPLLKNGPVRHSALMDYLCNANDDYDEDLDHKTLREIGIVLEQEKKKRVSADYYLDRSFSKNKATESIRHAETFQEILQNI